MTPAVEPRWKLIERVVALLEKTLTPDCHIEHNKKLPELGTGTLRQCDVIIRCGKPPRSTLTIVEVQKRNRKVTIGTYEGWCKKREKLGAQHLICVSVEGFPDSVVKDLAAQGDTVRLMTLCEPGEVPLCLRSFDTVMLQADIICTRDIAMVIFDKKPPEDLQIECNADSAIWEVEDAKRLVSMFDLAKRFLSTGAVREIKTTPLGPDRDLREFSLSFVPPNPRVWFTYCGERLFVAEARISYVIEKINASSKPKILAYEQKLVNGTLAYAALAQFQMNDGTQLDIQYGFLSNPDGTVRLTSSWLNIPGTTVLKSTGAVVLGWLQSAKLETTP
jgi:hypothetical protein